MNRPGIIEMVISQLVFWGVCLYAGIVLVKFFRAKPAPIKSVMIRILAAIFWLYLIAGFHYLLYDVNIWGDWNIWERIISNAPMLIALYGFNRYIDRH